MMVTFVSQCQKNALKKTRRVLDAFADRIGDNTWQTVITEEGLLTVKKLLRRTATKSTAVACHWIRSRSRSEFVWVVGKRKRFNNEGIVPVNSTQKNIINQKRENDWIYLPIIKSLVAIAALLHDWGKATLLFQEKLKAHLKKKPKSEVKIGDPLRHEWISCLLLNALVQQGNNSDEGWLQLLVKGNIDEHALKILVSNNTMKPLENLPPIAQLVGWLILTHHRLPSLLDKNKRNSCAENARENLEKMLRSIGAEWGYQNKDQDESRIKNCFQFPKGLLSQSQPWLKQLKKWSAKLLSHQPQIQQLLDNGGYRVMLHHARLCLMLGDHYYSSCPTDKNWQSTIDLHANTEKHNNKTTLKQKLDEHLVHVSNHALRISQSLSRFTTEMDRAYDIKKLKQKSPKRFEWQDKAVEKINYFRNQNPSFKDKDFGWFIVNMASTGCGKTIANAKIMRALSEDGESLRYILALGLRTLTLQTGDEYRERIGLTNDGLAVLIGSAAVQELHNQARHDEQDEPSFEDFGSESLENLLDEELKYDELPTADFLGAVFRQPKHKAFLYKPLLACTIDHIIAATETTRGGKYILPCLRLLSSDLVIDEVDDFDGKDLIAIGRLIHLAGMLGRKVMISSATIPPALAEGFFNVYQEGWTLHSHFRQAHAHIACAWVDEFGTDIQFLDKTDSLIRCQQYAEFHQQFIQKRVIHLQKQIIKRKGFIVPCDELFTEKTDEKTIQQKYFEKIKQIAIKLHKQHHIVDDLSGKRVSFGLIRLANIPPCVELTQHLLQTEWDEEIAPRIMAYHSRQVLLLRHMQEEHLDKVLKRKHKPEETPSALTDKVIRQHLDSTAASDVLFILIATPVEEVGRDHDFDWAIVEPSSYRSIIQLAGRVRRHRQTGIDQPNIAIMQYNLRALRKDGKPAFCRPGYEVNSLKLETHDLSQLIDESNLANAINAIPRIQEPENLRPKQQLADLEHQAIQNSLTPYKTTIAPNKIKGPQGLSGWLNECWWMTALPQQFNRFRDSAPDRVLYLIWQDGKTKFCEKNERGELIAREQMNKTQRAKPISVETRSRLWLERDYEISLRNLIDLEKQENEEDKVMHQNSKRYGEITLPNNDDQVVIYSDQFGLFLR